MSELAMTITGDKELLRMFAELPAAAQGRVLKPLLREGGAMLAAAERGESPRQSGLLALAIGATSLKSYSRGTLFIAAGVRRGFRRAVQAKARGGLRHLSARRSAESIGLPAQDPTKYVHLVTGGRKAVEAINKKVLYDPRTDRFFGRSVAEAKPNPFVGRAFDRAKDSIVAKITSEAPDRILAEAGALLGR